MKIRKIIAIAGVMCAVILCACGGDRNSGFDGEERMKLREVQEWADAVNILHRKDMEIMHFGRGKKECMYNIWRAVRNCLRILGR